MSAINKKELQLYEFSLAYNINFLSLNTLHFVLVHKTNNRFLKYFAPFYLLTETLQFNLSNIAFQTVKYIYQIHFSFII